MLKNKKGITLVALIITIIIMLILVGVTINVAINGGIFSNAKNASMQTEITQIQEQLLVKKSSIIADYNGEVPSDFGIGLSDLNIPNDLKTKYQNKLIISADGTLYYLEDNVNANEKENLESLGITAYQGEVSSVQYFLINETNDGKLCDLIYAIDYSNSTITIYLGEQNGPLQLVEGPIEITLSTNDFQALVDGVETTISGATAIIYEGSPVAYIQNNKAYLGEPHDNSLSTFYANYYATLVSNFNTSRLPITYNSIYNASYSYTYEELDGLTGKYVFLENGTYIVIISGITVLSPNITYSISGNTLTVVDQDMDGTSHTFTISNDLSTITTDDNLDFSRDQENFFIDSAENKSIDSDTGIYLNSIYKGTNNLYIVECDGIVTVYSGTIAPGNKSCQTHCALSDAISEYGFVVSNKTITYNDVVYTLVENESQILTNN